MMVFYHPIYKLRKFSSLDQGLDLLFQLETFGCQVTVILVEPTIFCSVSLVWIPLHWFGRSEQISVFNLHQDPILRCVEGSICTEFLRNWRSGCISWFPGFRLGSLDFDLLAVAIVFSFGFTPGILFGSGSTLPHSQILAPGLGIRQGSWELSSLLI